MIDLTFVPPKQLYRGKVIGKSANRLIIQLGTGTVVAYGNLNLYEVGDSVTLANVEGTYQVISKHKGVPNKVKEVYING